MRIRLLFLYLLLFTACDNILGDKSKIDDTFSQTGAVAIKIYSAAGGSGSEVGTATTLDYASINLYAISVDALGNYVEDVDVTWTMASNMGTLTTTSGSSTTFTPNAGVGSEVITASHTSLGADVTGAISIAFTISNVSGLEAWYRADLGVSYNGSNQVSLWEDQSANSNDAVQTGATTIMPLFVSSAINGMPALRFDGVDDFLTTVSSIVNGTGARTIFIVATNIANTGTYNVLLELTNTVTTAGTNYAITTESAVRISGNRVFNQGIGAGQTKVLSLYNAASATAAGIQLFLNGVQATENSVSPNAINTLVNPALIGVAAFAGSYCNCDIAEIAVYSEQLSVANRQAIESYLGARYSLF